VSASWVRCDWHPEHVDDRPSGERCGAPASHRIVWLDGSYSHGCSSHLEIDPDGPPHRIEEMYDRRSVRAEARRHKP